MQIDRYYNAPNITPSASGFVMLCNCSIYFDSNLTKRQH